MEQIYFRSVTHGTKTQTTIYGRIRKNEVEIIRINGVRMNHDIIKHKNVGQFDVYKQDLFRITEDIYIKAKGIARRMIEGDQEKEFIENATEQRYKFNRQFQKLNRESNAKLIVETMLLLGFYDKMKSRIIKMNKKNEKNR